jgi:cysteinyl-tRNA synthetase
MVLKLYNSLTRNLDEFKPQNPNEVTLYTCGPTVYDYPHIGNYRAYIFGDILKRTLVYNGYKVKHIMNLTDVDDKTIRNSQRQGIPLLEFTQKYTDAFFEDRDSLNIIPALKYTKATDHIKEMIEIVEDLIKKEYAYIGSDGSVYFDIKKDKGYGKLSKIEINSLESNASGRMKADEYDKENVQDFALWKAWDSEDGDVFWEPNKIMGREINIQKGRPGWHIECSAMSMKHLGETIDIHTGGIDNMFPHHENEIAQSECSTGKDFVKYWMHNEWLLVDGKKMAKSAGNFYTLRDLIKEKINPLSFRYLMLSTSYRSPLNFTWESLQGADTALKRLRHSYNGLGKENGDIDANYKKMFNEAINDDLNTANALGITWNLIKDDSIERKDKKATLMDFDTVLGLCIDKKEKFEIPEEIINLINERNEARKNKDFKESDRLRDLITEKGYKVLDTENGTEIEI